MNRFKQTGQLLPRKHVNRYYYLFIRDDSSNQGLFIVLSTSLTLQNRQSCLSDWGEYLAPTSVV